MERKPCARCGHTQRTHRKYKHHTPCLACGCTDYAAPAPIPRIDRSLAVPVATLVGAFILLGAAAAQAHPSYPKFVPGTHNKVLWPSHDAACDEAMDDKRWDDAVGPKGVDSTDGFCYQSLKEYVAAIDTVTNLKLPAKTTTIILNHLGTNEAMTDVEIAWGEKAQGNDATAQHAVEAAVTIYRDVMENYDGADPYIVEEFSDMFGRIEQIYPNLIPAEVKEPK